MIRLRINLQWQTGSRSQAQRNAQNSNLGIQNQQVKSHTHMHRLQAIKLHIQYSKDVINSSHGINSLYTYRLVMKNLHMPIGLAVKYNPINNCWSCRTCKYMLNIMGKGMKSCFPWPTFELLRTHRKINGYGYVKFTVQITPHRHTRTHAHREREREFRLPPTPTHTHTQRERHKLR